MRRLLPLLICLLVFAPDNFARAFIIDDVHSQRAYSGKRLTARQWERLQRQQELKEIEREKRAEREAVRQERLRAAAEARAAQAVERAERKAAYEAAKAAKAAELAAQKAAALEAKEQARLAKEADKQAKLAAIEAEKQAKLAAIEAEKQTQLAAQEAARQEKDEQMLAVANEQQADVTGWIDTDEGTRPAPRQEVSIESKEAPGTIIIDTSTRKLYYVLGEGRAIQYGIGVGRPGFEWMGVKSVTRKEEWPDWRPPDMMIERRPDLPRFMPGGPTNPLGARAMYLGSSLYRIHGSNEPETIGQAVSSGCFRMVNADVIDLYNRVQVGTKVIVR